MNDLNFNNIKFIKSYTAKPEDVNLPQVLFVGKSNVGKSTLINKLTNFNIAYVSSKPGFTKLLNFFLIDNSFYLVDAPGYGYSANNKKLYTTFYKMMDDYFNDNKYLRLILLLIDSRREISEDEITILEYLTKKQLKYCLLFTKYDKLNQKEKYKLKLRIEKLIKNFDINNYFISNINKKDNLKDLKEFISFTIFN